MLLTTSAIGSELPEVFYEAIKAENPNQLAYFVWMDNDCQFKREALNDIVESVLIRSRITPLKGEILTGRIYLSLEINCVSLKSGDPLYVINAHFGRWTLRPGIPIDHDFGTTETGPADLIPPSFKSSVEAAVTAYVKANPNF